MNLNPTAAPWNMPELNWFLGYPFALGMMATVALSLLLFFSPARLNWTIQMKSFVGRLWQAIQYWREIDGNFVAAAVSFYAGLAVFPLILVLMSLFGWFLAKSSYVQDWESRFIEFVANESSPRLADQLAGQLSQIQSGAILNGPLGLITLLVLSIALFVNLERAFDRIWQKKSEPAGILVNVKRILLHRLRAFLMLLGIIVIVVLNLAGSVSIEMITNFAKSFMPTEHIWRLAHLSVSILLNALLFTALYRTLPKEKVLWRHGFQGGCLTAISWEVGRYILSTIVISDKYNAFGVVGVFLALLLWLFYGVNVVLFGATFVRVTGRSKTSNV